MRRSAIFAWESRNDNQINAMANHETYGRIRAMVSRVAMLAAGWNGYAMGNHRTLQNAQGGRYSRDVNEGKRRADHMAGKGDSHGNRACEPMLT